MLAFLSSSSESVFLISPYDLYKAYSPFTPLLLPFVPLSILFHLLGTLLAVTGSVHLVPRLLVN